MIETWTCHWPDLTLKTLRVVNFVQILSGCLTLLQIEIEIKFANVEYELFVENLDVSVFLIFWLSVGVAILSLSSQSFMPCHFMNGTI